MKTARERAEEFMNRFYISDFNEEVLDSLIFLLKEQDKTTRHACAEAVLGIDPLIEAGSYVDAISMDDAHDACMNVKAV